ncbi:MAG: 2-nitropropane dioxygenase, partial [Burkholderiales bacterium]
MSAPFARVRFPLVQAPMAGAQGSALAVAVCRAGGIGSLPGAMLTPDALSKELATIRASLPHDALFNVNFFCHQSPAADEAVDRAWFTKLAPVYREFGIDPASIAAGPGRLPFSEATAEAIAPFAPPIVSFHFGL